MRLIRALPCLLASVVLAPRLQAQSCTYDWAPAIGQPGLNLSNVTYDAVHWDPDGPGPKGEVIVVGGNFGQAGGVPAISLAAWDPSTGQWSEVGGGVRKNPVGWGHAKALAVLPDGSLVVAGAFNQVGSQAIGGIARFDGTTWSPLGQGVNGNIDDLLVLPNGHLVACGYQLSGSPGVSSVGAVAWDGSTWYSLQTPFKFDSTEMRGMSPTPEGGFLAYGNFISQTQPGFEDIARWSPTAQPEGVWSSVGGGLPGGVYGTNGAVVLPNGNVLACGDLRYDGGLIYYAAYYDGVAWNRMDTGVDRRPTALALLPNGGLFMGTGRSSGVSGGCSNLCHLYDWNGSAWEIEAWICSNFVGFINVLDDGDVLIGGLFSAFNDYLFNSSGQVVGGTLLSVGQIMRLDVAEPQITQHPASTSGPAAGPHVFDVAGNGASGWRWQRRAASGVWTDLQDGPNSDATTGLALTAAGSATSTLTISNVVLGSAGPDIELRVVADNGCGFAYSDVATLTVIVPPPCTPSPYCTAKLSSHGCLPSISGSGTPSMSSPGGFSVVTTGMETTSPAIDFFGTTGQASAPFQGGWMCIASPVYRTGAKSSGGSGTCGGTLSFSLSELLATPNGNKITVGGTVYVETWSRDNGDAIGTSLSNAVRFTVCP